MRNRVPRCPPSIATTTSRRLAQLEAFEASARHLSFTKAADELALTQSAISRQIAALEEHYALPLFRRLHRALRLTDEGSACTRRSSMCWASCTMWASS
jgi:DNA-binding transcriptional LysR family regulator